MANQTYVLKKDLVIPAGSKFTKAPTDTHRVGRGHIMHTFGLTKDTGGEVAYCVADMTPEELAEWFEGV